MAKRINKAQLTRIYWPRWRAAEKVLIRAGFTKPEAEEKRKEIHITVTGSDCSSKDLTNNQLDNCLGKFLAISDPNNGTAQADAADQPLARIRWNINQIQRRLGLTAAYIDGMAANIARCGYAFCDELQLKAILTALIIHEKRHEKSEQD